jgi:hypothetical protein
MTQGLSKLKIKNLDRQNNISVIIKDLNKKMTGAVVVVIIW